MKSKQVFTEVFRKRFMWFNREDFFRARENNDFQQMQRILPPDIVVPYDISNALTDIDKDMHNHTWINANDETCTVCNRRDAYKCCSCGTARSRNCGVVFGFGTAHPVISVS